MEKNLILRGTPNPRQREFFASGARHTAYGGARGGGKSWAMRRKLVLLALASPSPRPSSTRCFCGAPCRNSAKTT